MNKIILALALGFGGLITYVDTRPNWDDTGITAVAIFGACALLGAVGPSRPWLWALAVGMWIPIVGVSVARNFGTLLVLVFAFAGAYAGMAMRMTLKAA